MKNQNNSITETISLLDKLRGKANKSEWANNNSHNSEIIESNDGNMTIYAEGGHTSDDASYIIALHNSYEALRQAALDGERYRKAGEVLAFIFESAREELPDVGFFTKTKFDAVMSAFKEAMDGKNDRWIDWGMRDMEDYRQAVDQKEV